jgi:hypothetical protein
MKWIWHALAALAVLALTSPGLGYRHLWQDEIETAERARTILESGYPRVIDRSGALSVNAGGREIEEGVAHRYSPWAQFYWAAAGLAPARALGASPDAGVRAPFVAAHAATSGLVSWGLSAVAGLSPAASAGVAVALGVQTVRVVHNRTARYHALLDLFVVAGLLGVGLLASRRTAGLVLVALSILVLPQIHTMAGAAFALCIGIAAGIRLLQLRRDDGAPLPLRQAAAAVAFPGVVTLALLVVVTRPWAQSAWGAFGHGQFRSPRELVQVGYALVAGLAAVAYLAARKRRDQAILLGTVLAVLLITLRLLDLHPFSQPRYYLSAVFFGLLWPMYAGLDGFGARERRALPWLLALGVLLPDLVLAPARPRASNTVDYTTAVGFLPFQGVRLAWSDAAADATRQPLRLALDHVREHGRPDDPVLVDYVPQFANWYLPGHPIALMPEPTARTTLNARSRAWEEPPPMPRWHVWYLNLAGGQWMCEGRCDYTAEERNLEAGTYVLSSKRLGRSVKMCVVARFPTEKWLNAPFRMLAREAFRPQGTGTDTLAVATPCESGAVSSRPTDRRAPPEERTP